MKLLIAGSRSLDFPVVVITHLVDCYFPDQNIECIITGGARGIDTNAAEYAHKHNIPLLEYYPDWDKHGKRAGILRNEVMGNEADALLAIWDGKSKGTEHMISYMIKLNKPVCIELINKVED